MVEPSFADPVDHRPRGKLKLYIGSAAGTGKSYRMLIDAHELRRRGVDVVVGYIETHRRQDTEAQLGDLEIVARKRSAYRGVVLEEMDVDAVIARRPEVVVVDELAHTNVPGTGRSKRWEDVVAVLEAGISVLSAVNVQHLESLNDVLQKTLGVTVRETVPDWVIGLADQVINLDISAEDLRQRLRDGKIYAAEKVQAALANFFTDENLSTLRELALREVANSVDRGREAASGAMAARSSRSASGGLLVAMSSRPDDTAALLRKASRIAGRLNRNWFCVYVQTPAEAADRIEASLQRRLVENIQRAQVMGAEVIKLESPDIAAAILDFARERNVALGIIGQSRHGWLHHLIHGSVVERLLRNRQGLDVMVASTVGDANPRLSGRGASIARGAAPARAYPPSAPIIADASSRKDPVRAPTRSKTDTTPADGTATTVASRDADAGHRQLLEEAAVAAQRPLTDASAALHILLDNHFGALNENQEEMLAAAQSGVSSASQELARLREILGSDAERPSARSDRVRVCDILRNLRPALQAEGRATAVTVTMDLPPGMPAVAADRVRLQQALQFVLGHIVRHATPGSAVEVGVQRDQSSLRILVAHAKPVTMDADLALARRIIQGHGGDITVTDTGTGITLPIETA